MQKNQQPALISRLLQRLPEPELSDEDRALKQKLSTLPQINILHLINQQTVDEGQAKDYEFSGSSMREHWESGHRDTHRTLRHQQWLTTWRVQGGITVHDVHRADQDDM